MNPSILIVFHSDEGQTAAIAQRVAHGLGDSGAHVTAVSVEGAPTPEGFDAVVLGDSIHLGRHSREMIRYAREHAQQLADVPTAVFQVSLTSAADDEASVQLASQMMDDFCAATEMEPDRIGLFAGALAFTRYRGMRRFIMRHMAEEEGLDTDTSTDHSYTDWGAVDSFAASVLRLVRRAAVPRTDGVEGLIDYDVGSVSPATPLREVVDRLFEATCRAVLVRSDDVDPLCTENAAGVVGIVTEYDILDAVREDADFDLVWAADVMSPAPITLPASASVDAMARQMVDDRVGHIVVRGTGREVGVVRQDVLLAALSR